MVPLQQYDTLQIVKISITHLSFLFNFTFLQKRFPISMM